MNGDPNFRQGAAVSWQCGALPTPSSAYAMLPAGHYEPVCSVRFDSSAGPSQSGARKHFTAPVTPGLLGGYVEPAHQRNTATAPPPPFAVDADVPPPLPRRGLQPPPRVESLRGGVDCRPAAAPQPPPQAVASPLDLLLRPGESVLPDEPDRPMRGRGVPPHSLLSRPAAALRDGEAFPPLEAETDLARTCRRTAPAPRSSMAALLQPLEAPAGASFAPPPARPSTAAAAEALANRLRNSLTHSELTAPPLYPATRG